MGKVTDNSSKFIKNRSSFVKMLGDLEGREAPYANIMEFFGGEQEILFAVCL